MKYKRGDIVNIPYSSTPYLIVDVTDYAFCKYLIMSIGNKTFNYFPESNFLYSAKLACSSIKHYSGPLTQEEIDEIIDAYNNGNYNPNGYNTLTLPWEESDIPGIISNEPPAFKGCAHKWKRYVGLMQSFDYCEYCDKKREDT